MKMKPEEMTNRELYTEYSTGDARQRYEALQEMTKRIHRIMVTPDVVAIFTQYKLNGAGDQRW